MKHITVARSHLAGATVGFCDLPSGRLQTLELPWRDNERNKSCIPEGTYIATRDETGDYRYYKITGVPNRSDIELHPANDVHELRGCTAFGLTRKPDSIGVYSSKKALQKLLQYCGDDDFLITYRTFNPNFDKW